LKEKVEDLHNLEDEDDFDMYEELLVVKKIDNMFKQPRRR
jgi:hypothetical protein